MKKIIFSLLLLLPMHFVLAQSEVDALRYSQIYFGGTARNMSMAGATGSMGADLSSLSNNPAGLGLYNRSEVTFSPSIFEGGTESTYLGNSEDDSRYNFSFKNVGAAFTFENTNKKSKWKSFQFGIGVNRLNDFSNQIRIEGENTSIDGTIMKPYFDYATDYGSGNIQPGDLIDAAAFDALLAYEANLLYDNDFDETNGYQWAYDAIYGGTFQQKDIETNGAIDEVALSFAGNYNNKLYLGATIGIQSIEYEETSIYREFDVADTIPAFNSLSKYDYLLTTGTGVNLKVGAIYRAAPWLRLGLAYHTPTFYMDMNDQYDSYMRSSLTLSENGGAEYFESEVSYGSFDYELITPSRIIASATFFIRNNGLFSIDYEMVDYTSASLDSDDYGFDTSNDNIETLFQKQNNLRLGTEWRYEEFYIRGGYALYGSPYENGNDFGETTFKTFGLGYRDGAFSIDFAYVNAEASDTYYIYDPDYAPVSTNDYYQNQYVVTLGFQF